VPATRATAPARPEQPRDVSPDTSLLTSKCESSTCD
jgi:hypothetical protein